MTNKDDTDFVIGLGFRSERYAEHGIGLKLSIPNMKILEFGDGEVAFC